MTLPAGAELFDLVEVQGIGVDFDAADRTSDSAEDTVGGAIGLGYVDTAKLPDPGEGSFSIEVAGERVPAEVSSTPIYDPASRRIRC